MEAIVAIVVVAAIAAGVYAALRKMKKKGSSGGFQVCWADDTWRLCYSKNAPLYFTEGKAPVIVMEKKAEPHYLVRPRTQALDDGKHLKITYKVEIMDGEPFIYAVDAANDRTPGIVSLFFQRRGDDMYAEGDKQFYRWWSVATGPLTPGIHTLTASLDAPESQWLSVFGKRSREYPEQFKDAKNLVRQIGLTFGGGGGRGHGVKVRGGSAKITVVGVWVE